jgi:UPF0755 protein
MKNFFITLGTVLLIIGMIVGGGYLFVTRTINTHTYKPIDDTATEADAIIFEIESGMWSSDVVEKLYEADLIRHEWIANQLVRFNSWGVIQAGEYEVHQGMSLYEMFARFTDGGVLDEDYVYIIVPEGAELTWIAHLFADALDIDADSLLALWADVAFLNELIEEYWFLTDEILNPELYYPLEGYFYPIRHEIPEELVDDMEAITRVMLNMTQHRLANVRSAIEEHDMTFHEILAFAAIIEAETQVAEDMPAVVGVFRNRLDNLEEFGGRLETDATVQYLLEERVTQVLWEHLQVASPFNTYQNAGLPPGPINSPSQSAINAVLNPVEHGYYFFITDMFGCYVEEGSDAAYSDPGRKIFAVTYSEHQAHLARYLQPSYDAARSQCNPNVQF